MSGIRLILRTMKVFILFIGCTLLFYYGIMWVNQEYEGYHRYDEPKGTAIKVNSTNKKDSNWVDRLLLFYLDGE
jgi:hypothetical protein